MSGRGDLDAAELSATGRFCAVRAALTARSPAQLTIRSFLRCTHWANTHLRRRCAERHSGRGGCPPSSRTLFSPMVLASRRVVTSADPCCTPLWACRGCGGGPLVGVTPASLRCAYFASLGCSLVKHAAQRNLKMSQTCVCLNSYETRLYEECFFDGERNK